MLTTFRRGTVNKRASWRPLVERLECRDCPSLAVSLSVTYHERRMLTLSGHVDGAQTSIVSVMFSGAVSGGTVCDAGGNFRVDREANSLGIVHCTAYAYPGITGSADLELTSEPPQINGLTAIWLHDNVWQFSGTVGDESPEGLVVSLGGIPSLANRSVTVGPGGSFSLVVSLGDGETGTATASTTDWWGLASDLAQTTVSPTG